MAYYYDLLNSSDDEDIFELINRRNQETRQRLDAKFKVYKPHRNYLEELDDTDFKMRFRLEKQTVISLCEEIKPFLTFPSNRNNPISPMDQLLLTLRLFATGSYHVSMRDFIGVSTATAYRITSRVTNAIASLRPQYIKFPSTIPEIRREQARFYAISGFPKVVGCIDCTHVRIQSFGGPEAEIFRNRKGYFSMNVQAVTNANLEITDIVARWQGSAHDCTIFDNSRLCAAFESGHYGDAVLLGDSGYPLKPFLLTPILEARTAAERRYNESHIRTRNTVERLFGIWKRRFPILALGIRYSIEKTMSTIVATAVLHNIARRFADPLPQLDRDINLPAEWDDLLQYNHIPAPIVEVRNPQNAFVRNNIIHNYFNRL